jgi:hypothetical protein
MYFWRISLLFPFFSDSSCSVSVFISIIFLCHFLDTMRCPASHYYVILPCIRQVQNTRSSWLCTEKSETVSQNKTLLLLNQLSQLFLAMITHLCSYKDLLTSI